MLSKISKGVRSFIGGDNKEQSRKRKRDSFEDDILEVDTPTKRGRVDIWEKQSTRVSAGEQWNFTPFPMGKVAEWIVKKKTSFRENFYIRKIVESPSRIMKKITGISNTQPSRSGDQGPPRKPQTGFRNPVHPGGKGTLQFGVATGMSTAAPQPPPQPSVAHSTPKKGEGAAPSSGSHGGPGGGGGGGGYPPPKVGYADLPYPFVIPEISRGPEDFHYHIPPVRSSSLSGGHPDIRPGLGRVQYPSGHRLHSPRGSPQQGYRSIYEKTFNASGGSFNNTTINRGRNKLAVKESIRLEEKSRYAQLLQQFTSAPLSGTAFGSGHIRKPRVPPVRTGLARTPLGSDVSGIQDLHSQESIEVSADTPKQYLQPNKSLTPARSAGLTDRSFLTIQSLRAQREDSRSSPEVIILDDKEDRQKDRAAAKSPDATSVCGRPTVDSLPSPKPAAAAALEKSLKENKFASEDWIHDLTGKYSLESRRRHREVKEEEIKCNFFKEKREEWEHMLEQKLRKRLSLAEREPGILEEDYEEEEDEDEFPELTPDMEEVIENALYPHPPNEVLAEAFRLQIKRCDMITLAGLNWLNDEIINFYMELLKDRGTQDDFPTIHVFNTFFYPKLMSGGHSALKRWTKKIDLFSVDYIIIPVHLGMHWCLSVVDLTKKEIRYYDSMGGVNNACLNALREYLRQEHEIKKSSPLDMSTWKLISMKNIPQQMNGSDCGVFTCKFAEYISRGADITFTQEHMPYFRQRMVYEILTTKLL